MMAIKLKYSLLLIFTLLSALSFERSFGNLISPMHDAFLKSAKHKPSFKELEKSAVDASIINSNSSGGGVGKMSANYDDYNLQLAKQRFMDNPVDPPIAVIPPALDFGKVNLCTPTVATITIHNISPSKMVIIKSIKADNIQVHPPDKFKEKQLRPGRKLQYKLILLPRKLGIIQSNALIETSIGVLMYGITAQALPNRYDVNAIIGVTLPLSRPFNSLISITNSGDSLIRVTEVFTSEAFFHLSLPSTDATKHGSSNINDDISYPSREGSLWEVQPYSRRDVIQIDFSSHVSGEYYGYIHIRTSDAHLVVPVDILVMEGGVHAQPRKIDFGVLSVKDTSTFTVSLLNSGSRSLKLERFVVVHPTTITNNNSNDDNGSEVVANNPIILCPTHYPLCHSNQSEHHKIVIRPGEELSDAFHVKIDATTSGVVSGKIVVYTNESSSYSLYHRVEVPYQVRVVSGSIAIDEDYSTKDFTLQNFNRSTQVRSFNLFNGYEDEDITLRILDAYIIPSDSSSEYLINYNNNNTSCFDCDNVSKHFKLQYVDYESESVIAKSMSYWSEPLYMEYDGKPTGYPQRVCVAIVTNLTMHIVQLYISPGVVYVGYTDAGAGAGDTGLIATLLEENYSNDVIDGLARKNNNKFHWPRVDIQDIEQLVAESSNSNLPKRSFVMKKGSKASGSEIFFDVNVWNTHTWATNDVTLELLPKLSSSYTGVVELVSIRPYSPHQYLSSQDVGQNIQDSLTHLFGRNNNYTLYSGMHSMQNSGSGSSYNNDNNDNNIIRNYNFERGKIIQIGKEILNSEEFSSNSRLSFGIPAGFMYTLRCSFKTLDNMYGFVRLEEVLKVVSKIQETTFDIHYKGLQGRLKIHQESLQFKNPIEITSLDSGVDMYIENEFETDVTVLSVGSSSDSDAFLQFKTNQENDEMNDILNNNGNNNNNRIHLPANKNRNRNSLYIGDTIGKIVWNPPSDCINEFDVFHCIGILLNLYENENSSITKEFTMLHYHHRVDYINMHYNNYTDGGITSCNMFNTSPNCPASSSINHAMQGSVDESYKSLSQTWELLRLKKLNRISQDLVLQTDVTSALKFTVSAEIIPTAIMDMNRYNFGKVCSDCTNNKNNNNIMDIDLIVINPTGFPIKAGFLPSEASKGGVKTAGYCEDNQSDVSTTPAHQSPFCIFSKDQVAIIEPYGNFTYGPIRFQPTSRGTFETTLYLMNNLTYLEPFYLTGLGISDEFVLTAVTTDHSSNSICDDEGLTLTTAKEIVFNYTSEAISDGLYEVMDEIQKVPLSQFKRENPSWEYFSLSRSYRITNTGEVSVRIHYMDILTDNGPHSLHLDDSNDNNMNMIDASNYFQLNVSWDMSSTTTLLPGDTAEMTITYIGPCVVGESPVTLLSEARTGDGNMSKKSLSEESSISPTTTTSSYVLDFLTSTTLTKSHKNDKEIDDSHNIKMKTRKYPIVIEMHPSMLPLCTNIWVSNHVSSHSFYGMCSVLLLTLTLVIIGGFVLYFGSVKDSINAIQNIIHQTFHHHHAIQKENLINTGGGNNNIINNKDANDSEVKDSKPVRKRNKKKKSRDKKKNGNKVTKTVSKLQLEPSPIVDILTATVTGVTISNAGASNAGVSTADASYAGASNAGASNAGVSTADASNAGASNAGVSTAGASNAGASNAGASNAGVSNAGVSTAGASTAGASNAGVSNTGASTAGVSTAGASNAGVSNAGVSNAGVSTAGVSTAGVSTAGVSYAGVSNAGASNTGVSHTAPVTRLKKNECVGELPPINDSINDDLSIVSSAPMKSLKMKKKNGTDRSNIPSGANGASSSSSISSGASSSNHSSGSGVVRVVSYSAESAVTKPAVTTDRSQTQCTSTNTNILSSLSVVIERPRSKSNTNGSNVTNSSVTMNDRDRWKSHSSLSSSSGSIGMDSYFKEPMHSIDPVIRRDFQRNTTTNNNNHINNTPLFPPISRPSTANTSAAAAACRQNQDQRQNHSHVVSPPGLSIFHASGYDGVGNRNHSHLSSSSIFGDSIGSSVFGKDASSLFPIRSASSSFTSSTSVSATSGGLGVIGRRQDSSSSINSSNRHHYASGFNGSSINHLFDSRRNVDGEDINFRLRNSGTNNTSSSTTTSSSSGGVNASRMTSAAFFDSFGIDENDPLLSLLENDL